MLAAGRTLVADGAMGTMLFKKGLASGDCPEQVNLDHPYWLEQIASAYLEAGSDIVETNTFGGSPLKLAQYSLEDKTEEINTAAVRAARNAVGDRALVAASCGPCGHLLKPYGDIEPEQVLESFERQIRALVDAGVDLVCVETMTDLNEAILAVEACRRVSSSLPVSATMTFDFTPNGYFTIMGASIEQAAHDLADAGADVVGSNCGNGIVEMIRIAAEFKKHSNLPLLIQSNAGLPELKDETLVYPETPVFMAGRSRRLIDLGVNIIGGCCGTTPEHIAAIRAEVDRAN